MFIFIEEKSLHFSPSSRDSKYLKLFNSIVSCKLDNFIKVSRCKEWEVTLLDTIYNHPRTRFNIKIDKIENPAT